MNRVRLTRLLIIGVMLTGTQLIFGQQRLTFSLEEAQEYAIQHNFDVKNSKTDVEIAEKFVNETMALGLPQVNASATYNNYLNIPTQLIPDFLSPAVIGVNEQVFGLTPVVPVPDETQYFEAKFGIQHNLTAGATVNQLLFSGPYLVGLKAARAYVDSKKTNLQKSEIDIKTEVAKAYFPLIIIKENKKVLDSTLISLEKMLYETSEFHKSGFLEDTDVDQIELLISEMESTLTNIENQLEIASNYLKFYLGIQSDIHIEATEDLNKLLLNMDYDYLLNSSFDHNQNIQYKVIKDQENLAYLDMRRYKTEYLPSLSAFYSYQVNGMRDKFNFFDFTQDWYPNQVLGVQLDVPIFSSGSRKSKVQQAKLKLDKIETIDKQMELTLNLTANTARSEFNNAYLVYLNRVKSMNLAKKIYQKTEVKYKEGISTSLELSQTHNQFMQTEIDRLTATLNLLTKKAELDKILTKIN